MHLHSPASYDDAIALVESATPTFDTPGQHDVLARPSLERTRSQRHPDADAPPLVWAASHDDRLLGLVGGRRIGDLALVDLVALPTDARAAALVIDAATRWARTHDEAEVSFEAPSSPAPLERDDVAAAVALLAEAGWRVLVTRRHYRLDAGAAAAARAAGAALLPRAELRLDRAGDGDRDRLADLLAHVLVDSLDVRDTASIAEHGVRGAADRLADELVDADPIECIRFAVVDGEDAGVVSWRPMDDGRAFVLFVGVADGHRGRGLAAALVAAATDALFAGGASTLIADTDDANVPMIRAFAKAGWEPTASRIDLELER